METNEIKSQQPSVADKNDLIIDRVFDLPVSKVWQPWTEPETSKKWWGPKDYTCPFCSIDLKTGNLVVAEGTVKCKMKDGGLLDALFCDVFHIENGKIKQLTTYQMNK